jgi:hypothetical protein
MILPFFQEGGLLQHWHLGLSLGRRGGVCFARDGHAANGSDIPMRQAIGHDMVVAMVAMVSRREFSREVCQGGVDRGR